MRVSEFATRGLYTLWVDEKRHPSVQRLADAYGMPTVEQGTSFGFGYDHLWLDLR